ncbi:MAG: hypothetical protein WC480_04835 [Patescibacteria group bacterium]
MNLKTPTKVTKIVLPNNPHFDPLAAYYLLVNFGQEQFIDIAQAPLEFWAKSESPSPAELTAWQSSGVLTLDISGGDFDHHHTEKTVTRLVAEFLGLDQKPELQNLLQYIDEDEIGLHNKYGEVPYIVKCMYKDGKSIEQVKDYVFNTLNYLQSKETLWFVEAKQEFDAKAKVIKVKRGERKLKVIVLESDNIDIANFARQHEAASTVIQQRSTGHIFIFTNKADKIDLAPVIKAIRIRELQLAGKKVTDSKNLIREGKYPGLEMWYYHLSFNAIFNGSHALLDTPATKISLAEIISIVVYGVGADFPEYCKDKCIGDKCPFYAFDWRKCQSKK